MYNHEQYPTIMRILSLDIGTKNLGWVLYDGEIKDVGIVDLSTFAKGTDYAKQVYLLSKTGFFDVDLILVEIQMRSCMKTIANSIRCFYWDKTIRIAPQSVRRHFKTITKKHKSNKQAHLALLSEIDIPTNIVAKISTYKKKDDIADAIVQMMYYLQSPRYM
tara:strand:+ start:2500 stop:2985 length:486 start_codon:yes stop_codon:yes gene_type:complete